MNSEVEKHRELLDKEKSGNFDKLFLSLSDSLSLCSNLYVKTGLIEYLIIRDRISELRSKVAALY